MNTFRLFSHACIVMSLLFTGTILAEEHHQDSPEYSVKPLTDSITMLQGKGGNIAVLKGKQGILLVDDDYKAMSEKLLTKLDVFGGVTQLKYIINTHWHGDHTEGNLALGQYANIVAHDNVRTRLLSEQEVKLFGMKSEPYPEPALPSITYEKTMSLYMNDEEIELVHFAGGHTDGDSVVFFKNANVVHVGDHFFNGFFPFVDVENGGNVLVMAANVKTLLGMIDDKTQVIPGHGPLGNKAELQAFHDMLVGTSNEVKKMKKKGMSLEEIQKNGLSEKWDAWTKGFLSEEVWIGIIFSSL